mmetsp:Transcript_35283/g.88216  ORF Transcript_35283/g.88216 Transcript_35283/m.88216 type:complete len:304 (+) Transcript_35283:1243-2154(+)
MAITTGRSMLFMRTMVALTTPGMVYGISERKSDRISSVPASQWSPDLVSSCTWSIAWPGRLSAGSPSSFPSSSLAAMSAWTLSDIRLRRGPLLQQFRINAGLLRQHRGVPSEGVQVYRRSWGWGRGADRGGIGGPCLSFCSLAIGGRRRVTTSRGRHIDVHGGSRHRHRQHHRWGGVQSLLGGGQSLRGGGQNLCGGCRPRRDEVATEVRGRSARYSTVVVLIRIVDKVRHLALLHIGVRDGPRRGGSRFTFGFLGRPPTSSSSSIPSRATERDLEGLGAVGADRESSLSSPVAASMGWCSCA